MKYIPTLFSTEMVQAIFYKNKTKTRRTSGLDTVNGMNGKGPKPNRFKFLRFEEVTDSKKSFTELRAVFTLVEDNDESHKFSLKCPYGNVGDILWVRESFSVRYIPQPPEGTHDGPEWFYKATPEFDDMKFHPSIHMPKEACRIFLKVKSIGIERLQDISEQDAIAEGVHRYDSGFYANYSKTKGLSQINREPLTSAIKSFNTLWMRINGITSFYMNPWVWVIEFERIEKPENWSI